MKNQLAGEIRDDKRAGIPDNKIKGEKVETMKQLN